MENKEKYFIPEISDLRLGYEYETNFNCENKWVKKIVNDLGCERDGCGELQDLLTLINYHNSDILDYQLNYANMVRVPYLTKEQIENEGWALQEEFPYVHSIGLIKNLTYRGTNHTVFLYYNYSSKWLLITIQSVIDNIYSIKYTTEKTDININGNTLYAGTCLDINTFRYICKLLEI